MGLTAFDPDSSTNGTPEIGRQFPAIALTPLPDKTQAMTDLLQGKSLTHTYGVQREWEVRTTLVTNRQAWRYRSSVLVHGKELSDIFSPVHVDRSRQLRQAGLVTEEMLTTFASEAVEVHFTRCANVEEYSLLASIYSQPLPRRFGMHTVALSLFCVAALAVAYLLWFGPHGLVDLDLLYKQFRSDSMRWQSVQISYHYPAGEPFILPLPALAGMPERTPVEIALETANNPPRWLELDRQSLSIRGTAPQTAAGQTYQLYIRAHTQQGSDSRLLVSLTITAQPELLPPPPQPETPTPRLRGHWTW